MSDAEVTDLRPPAYTEEECQRVVDYVMGLRASEIRVFLGEHELPVSGNKLELRERIEEALEEDTLTYADVTSYLDRVAPWGKQHVFLYRGPRSRISRWRDPHWVHERLKEHRLGRLFNARLPIILPDSLSVSSITHDGRRLRVTAIERREYFERIQELDRTDRTAEGEDVELRAYVRYVTRGLVAFDWNLTANTASLHISQLPSGSRYEEVVQAFAQRVGDWLPVNTFRLLDIGRAIARLHELEEAGEPEARSHALDYRTLEGRRLTGTSASAEQELFGEQVIDEALRGVRGTGVGHLGNFYWLPSTECPNHGNPLAKRVHVFIVGNKNRVNFPTPSTEEIIRYVLARIRALSR